MNIYMNEVLSHVFLSCKTLGFAFNLLSLGAGKFKLEFWASWFYKVCGYIRETKPLQLAQFRAVFCLLLIESLSFTHPRPWGLREEAFIAPRKTSAHKATAMNVESICTISAKLKLHFLFDKWHMLECSLIKHIYIIHIQMMPRNISLIYFCSINTKRHLQNVILYISKSKSNCHAVHLAFAVCMSLANDASWRVRGCTSRWRSPPSRRIEVNRRSESLSQLGNNNLFKKNTAFKDIFTLGTRTTSLNLFNTDVNAVLVKTIFFFKLPFQTKVWGRGGSSSKYFISRRILSATHPRKRLIYSERKQKQTEQ